MAGKYNPSIDDVLQAHYGNSIEARQKYNSWLRAGLAPDCENDAKNAFACVGKVRKIPRSMDKTFDFEIKSKNIMFEVTQIHPPSFNILSDPNNRILRAIRHIGEKESNTSVVRGGVIYYSTITAFLEDLPTSFQNTQFITSEMTKYNLSFIVFLPEKAVVPPGSENMPYPSLLYVSKEHKATLGCLDSDIQRLAF